MAQAMTTHANWNGIEFAAEPPSRNDHEGHPHQILRLHDDQLPHVDQTNLARYHDYLRQRLPLPLPVTYPPAANENETTDSGNGCSLVELLAPWQATTEPYAGIQCRISRPGIQGDAPADNRDTRYETVLPLTEVEVPPGSPGHELIETYCRWFWHWQ